MRFVGGNMKITKQARAAWLVVLVAISILPGCGKSKNNEGVPPPVGIVAPPVIQPPVINPPAPGGPGQCANLSGVPQGQGITLYFSGNNVMGGSGLYGAMYVSGAGGGYQYWRTNMFGDRIDVGLSGSTGYAQVYLAPITVDALRVNAQGQVCGVWFNTGYSNTQASGSYQGTAWQGTLGGGLIGFIGGNGQAVLTQYGKYMVM